MLSLFDQRVGRLPCAHVICLPGRPLYVVGWAAISLLLPGFRVGVLLCLAGHLLLFMLLI